MIALMRGQPSINKSNLHSLFKCSSHQIYSFNETRGMITSIIAKLKQSYGQINIDKYRVAAYKILQSTISEQNVMHYVVKKHEQKNLT